MRLRVASFLALLCLLPVTVLAQGDVVSFNLSTSKTFSPGEQPKIHLYTHNVDALEFRVYKVKNPVKFVENLRELHSFGPEAGLLDKEQIDERTWLEKFHDWKTNWWHAIRDFFRYQFSREARAAMRDKQSSLTRQSRIVRAEEFAQIPLLNESQLVARWRQLVPSTFISDANNLAVPKLGAGLYLVEATDGRFKAYTLLVVTDMALVTRTGSGSVMAYAVNRASGIPMTSVKVDAGFGTKLLATAMTSNDGIAQLAVPADKSSPDNFWVVASSGDEVAVSTPASYALTVTSGGKYSGYAFTERPVYRPTHTVHWKAILREHAGNALVVPKAGKVHVTISDESDKQVFDQQVSLSAEGTVTGDFTLPKDASLGYYTVQVGDDPENSVTCGFHVEDYRKPDYRVQVTAAQKRILEGNSMQVTIDSQYFFGEPVANAKVKYRVYHSPHYWWGEEEDSSDPDAASADDPSDQTGVDGDEDAEKTGKLDAKGLLVIQVPTHVDASGETHVDQDYVVEAGVTDAANREITGRGRFLATYGTFRVNVEPVSYAVHAGENAKFKITALDYDDKPISTRVHVQLLFRHYQDGKTQTINGASVDVTTDARGQAIGEVPVGSPQYSSAELLATASVVQPGTRTPTDSSYLWIAGAGEVSWDSSSETTQIVADKKTYAPGDIAHLSIVSETNGFYALVVAQGYTTQMQQVMHSDGKTLAFDLPITADSQPNITVQALFIKDNVLYQASKVLKIPPAQQKLNVKLTPAKDSFQPQQSASYDVTTTDFTGKPVSADVSFGVVDEAIYSLYPDESGDMLRKLFPQRYAEAQIDSSLDFYFSGEAGEKSPMLAMRNARYHPQLAQVKPGNEAKPKVRKAFPDTAFWSPDVHTDATGHAHVSVTFPDSLTTWRTTVHAITNDSKAGSEINRVLVRKNVLVRMGTPRFMLKGDEITLPVIVHNYLDTEKAATVSLKVEGLDTVSGSQQNVTIPSKGEATLLWRLHASQVGTAKLTASAITDVESDALELSFPVQPAGVEKILQQSGAISSSGSQTVVKIIFPERTDLAAHSLHVEVSSSIAGSLVPALRYLTSYPYGCTEQTMSSYLPDVIVAGTLKQLQLVGVLDRDELNSKMQAGLERLKDHQHDDGGWGWWKEDESRVYMTAYVVGGIGQGAQITPLTTEQRTMLESGKQYLQTALKDHPRMRPELRAAVVYALAEAGANDIAPALDAQWSKRSSLDPEALAMTGLAMLKVHDARASEIADMLQKKAVREGELVSWMGSYVPMLDADYADNSEATAYVVRFLSKAKPDSPLLSSAAQWLMLQRTGGIWWDSTEQTAMVLFGLADYLSASHELDSDFTAEILVNGKSVGQHHFTAADAQTGTFLHVDVEAQQLLPGGNDVQIVRRNGTGRTYWSTRGSYYSTEKRDVQAGSMSLNLTRDYYTLQPTQKDGKVMYSLQPFHGTAQIGDVLAVHEAINGTPMKYLLLEDPIPAGAEFIQNEDSYPIDHRPGGWIDWFTRREFHDDHAAFFASDFTGRQEIFYLIRVVNPGNFQISPASVQPMYQPGIQATSDAQQLQVVQPVSTGGQQ